MELTTEQLDQLKEWNEAKQLAKIWVEKESTLRDTLVKALFNCDKDEGTESITVQNDWTLKVTKKLSYSLNNDEGEVSALCASLPDSLSKQLIRWKPDLSLSTYRKLDNHTRDLFNSVLTIKPAKPSLELIAPAP
jgi:hypothetical protein